MASSDLFSRPNEELEGLDPASEGGFGDYPLDSVFVRTEQRTVAEVIKRIDGDRYILDPDFQRDFVWSPEKQSKLIESCVMRIPLPVFYVAEAKDGRIIVVDGLQRLTTFSRFLSNQLRLQGLVSEETKRGSHALEGKKFSELPINLQERVQDTQLTMYILDAKAPERARLDIFERVNSGEPLTRQQMRNALYSGAATEWLRDAAKGEAFRKATGESLNAKTMRDREAINRFCAFALLGWQTYRTGDMDDFLASGLLKLGDLTEPARRTLREQFDHSMLLNRQLFGDHAFRKSLAADDPKASRTIMNISLFEICAVTMAKLPTELAPDKQSALRKAVVAKVQNDEEFIRSITYSTNSTGPVHTRFSTMEALVARAMSNG
ncbi:MAG: DUF262 domain-containing protein [Hyphomonadaceae bacterium]